MNKHSLASLAAFAALGVAVLPPDAKVSLVEVGRGLCPKCGKPGVKRTSKLSYHTACGYLGDA